MARQVSLAQRARYWLGRPRTVVAAPGDGKHWRHSGQHWGYALWGASGAISVYASIVLWFAEREYVYPTVGPLAYFTYIWGFFVYWGLAVIAYTVWRLA